MAEKVNIETLLVYTSPACPPKEIKLSNIYYFGKDNKGTYLVSNGEKKYEKIEYIKTYFTPEGQTWDETL